jgi:hypothetical protein
MTIDAALTFIVRALWIVVALAVCTLIVQQATAPDYRPRGVVGSILGPDRTR